MRNEMVKIVVSVPISHANIVRKALGENNAGAEGKYRFCSFSSKGTGRFLPLFGAKPAIGKVGKLEKVTEEQIETFCRKKDLKRIIKAVKKVHPYEEMVFDIYPLLDYKKVR